jgi:regulator of protease activity HflC (stomatin/prohibitin superfamily)
METYPATLARRIDLGGAEPKIAGNKAILWTNDHGVTETYFAVRPAADDFATTAGAIGGENMEGKNFALASVELPLYYTVEDYAKFDALGAPEERDDLLMAIGRREAFMLLATMDIDEVLGKGRSEISTSLKARIESEYAKLNDGKGAGVKVLYVGVEGVHPPRDAAGAFEDIVKGEQQATAGKEVARKDANTSVIAVAGSVEMAEKIVRAIDELNELTDTKSDQAKVRAKQREIEDLLVTAGGMAASTIQKARADRWTRHMQARAAATAFTGQTAGFHAAPEVYAARLYFDALTTLMKDARVYIVNDEEGQRIHVNTNLEDLNTGGNMFNTPKPKEE